MRVLPSLIATALPVLLAASNAPTPAAGAPPVAAAPAKAPAAPASGAKTMTVDELRTIQDKMKSSDALTVDFVQTKVSGLRGKPVKREGRAVFVKPNLFKWMLETPRREYKIFDGKALFDYSPDTFTAARYATTGPQSSELRQVIDLVLNFDSLLKRYHLIKAEEEAGVVTIQLTPKAASDITAVELRLDEKASFVSLLKLTFSNKTTLTDEFRNPSRKPVAGDAFTLPKGVKLTDSM